MGLSDFFKKTLTSEKIEYNDIKVSDPGISREITKSKSSIPSINKDKKDITIFTDLKDETIEKIKNNPFWNEYSPFSQEKMVSKYFDNKIKRSKYNGIKYSLSDKRIFIEDVLKSVV